jgi:hypothetical protein
MQLIDQRSFARRLTDTGDTGMAGSGEARGPAKKKGPPGGGGPVTRNPLDRALRRRARPILRAPVDRGVAEPRQTEQHHGPRRGFRGRPRRRRP